jgi:hypothetical protein
MLVKLSRGTPCSNTSRRTPGALLPRRSSWRSIMPSLGLMWHISAPWTPPNHCSAPVAPHSAPPNTSPWSAVGSFNTDLTAASILSIVPSATPNCMCQSRTLIASSPSYRTVTRPSGPKPARRSPHPLSQTREVSSVGLSPSVPMTTNHAAEICLLYPPCFGV